MDRMVFRREGCKVTKLLNGRKVDFQVFGSEGGAEQFIEQERTLYAFRVPPVAVSVETQALAK